MLRTHLLICFILLLLCIPIYLLSHYSLKSSGGNWISLDLSNLLIRAFVLFIGIHITISTLVIIYYQHFNLLKTHLFSFVVALTIIGVDLFIYGKITDHNYRKERIAKTEQRKTFFNDIRLIRWWFLPGAKNPKEIHIDLEVASSGRLAALARGNEDRENENNIFSSDGEAQHLVKAGETIHYVFPLTFNNPGHANDIEFTFHLFKHAVGQSGVDDVSKIFKDSIDNNDDGSYFYEKLVPPLNERPK